MNVIFSRGAVSISYSLMQKIADLVGSPQPGIGVPEDKIQELRDYLLVCMPFGTPMEMEPATVRGILASRDSVMPQKQKVTPQLYYKRCIQTMLRG